MPAGSAAGEVSPHGAVGGCPTNVPPIEGCRVIRSGFCWLISELVLGVGRVSSLLGFFVVSSLGREKPCLAW